MWYRKDTPGRQSWNAGRLLAVLLGSLALGGSGPPADAITFSSGTLQPGVARGVIENTQQPALMPGGVVVTPPALQTIAGGDTITANACGGLKQVTAAGAVTTNLTDSITDPTTVRPGCDMKICNVGATNTITIDKNAHLLTLSGLDIALAANSCVGVVNDGATWRQTGAVFTAS